jgi:hypothetical protein
MRIPEARGPWVVKRTGILADAVRTRHLSVIGDASKTAQLAATGAAQRPASERPAATTCASVVRQRRPRQS